MNLFITLSQTLRHSTSRHGLLPILSLIATSFLLDLLCKSILKGLEKDYLFKSVMKISSIMKPSWFWVLLLMLGAALICISFTGKTCAPKSTGVASTEDEKDTVVAVTSRKLKYLDYSQVSGNSNAGSISPQDYGPVDPVPSSKASIQAGPIQHGTPLMPYIPPSPPAPSSP